MYYVLYSIIVLFSIFIVVPFLNVRVKYFQSDDEDWVAILGIMGSVVWPMTIFILIMCVLFEHFFKLYKRSFNLWRKPILNLPQINDAKSTYRHIKLTK